MQSDAKLTATLDHLANHVLNVGIGAASLRQLASAAGTSDRMLLYYWRDKDELLKATLAVIAARLTALMDFGGTANPAPLLEVTDRLTAMLDQPAFWPYQRLFLEIAARAATGDALCRAVGEELGRGFLAWGEAQIDAPDATARSRDAARLLLIIEGTVFLRAIGLEDVTHRALD
jgi:AcrR family transcriptional regulator